jgi:hypothetical protein
MANNYQELCNTGSWKLVKWTLRDGAHSLQVEEGLGLGELRLLLSFFSFYYRTIHR